MNKLNCGENMAEKLRQIYFKLKTYWRKPPSGYMVSYKEFVSFALGAGGLSFISILVQWTTIATSTYMMISYFRASGGLIWVLTIAAAVICCIRSPILSAVIDNSNSKKGKFKPFLLWASIGTVICLTLVPFIPDKLNNIIAFSFRLPAMPILKMADPSNIHVSVAVILMFVLVQAGLFFHTLLNQAIIGIEQTLTSVAQERANIGALKGLISNIPGSIVNMIIPLLVGSVFARKGGYNSIEMYRWIFPVCAVLGVFCMLFIIRGTKERVVVKQNYVAKVGFIEGFKILLKNKYFWIINLVSVFTGIKALANITNWIKQYSFVSDTAKTLAGLYCTTLLMNVLVLGMVLGPLLIKKFGKRNVMIVSNVGYFLMVGMQLLMHKQPILILIVSLFQNCFMGLDYITMIMTSDVMDYIQWKTGKRLEGTWQNASAIITTIAGIFTGMLAPIFLAMGGISFGVELETALVDETLRNNAYKYQTLLALIGSFFVMLPMFFYDLTEKKHANYIRVLKIRSAVDNYKDNVLSGQDVITVKEIKDEAELSENKFVLDELAKYDCIEEIIKNYDAEKAEALRLEREEEKQQFVRDIELEIARVKSRVERARLRAEKAKEKALAKGVTTDVISQETSEFDAEASRLKYMRVERHSRHFIDGELSAYREIDQIKENLEEIYTVLEGIWEEEKEKQKQLKAEKLATKQAKKNKSK